MKIHIGQLLYHPKARVYRRIIYIRNNYPCWIAYYPDSKLVSHGIYESSFDIFNIRENYQIGGWVFL